MRVPKAATVVTVLAVSALAMGASGCDTQQQNSGGSSNNQQQGEQQPAKAPEPKKASSQEIYDKVQNGMTKEQLVQIAGKEPDNCIDQDIEGIGKSSTCSYGTVSITLTNGAVSSKIKL